MGFKGLNKFRKKYDKMKDEALHKVTKQAFTNLVIASPVLIGNFRGSWLGSAVTPRVGNPDAFDGGAGTSGSIQSQRLTNAGITLGMPPTSFELSNLSPALKSKFGQTVYITNNIAYAKKLENGGSDQAPAGVLHVSAQKTRAQMSKSKAV